MNNSLETYHIKIKTVGPVFVGDGRKYYKKEYAFFSRKEIGILDITKLYFLMRKKGIWEQFEEYFIGNDRRDLVTWLQGFRISLADIRPCVKYMLNSEDTVYQKGTNIISCIKDSYGMAYIPGSTIKGMLRTILLADDIMEERTDYESIVRSIGRELNYPTKNRKDYLKEETSRMEQLAFYTLNRDRENASNAVNDMLSGFIVSDSAPITTDHLMLCQKIDRHVNGVERSMPLLRESIRPNVEIEFDLTIDKSLCKITVEQLKKAIGRFNKCYNECFLSAFDMGLLEANHIFIGGGSGFVSKTVLYPLFGKNDGIDAAQKVFKNTNVPLNHKHVKDKSFGASPHILKCTKCGGKIYQMGLCKIVAIDAV